MFWLSEPNNVFQFSLIWRKVSLPEAASSQLLKENMYTIREKFNFITSARHVLASIFVELPSGSCSVYWNSYIVLLER